MKDGKEHGKGTMNYASGDKYTGIWVNGNRTGQGVYTHADGNRYEGQFKDSKKHGKGTLIWAPRANGSSSKYVGDWIDGNMTGYGVYTFANGDRYELRYSPITRQGLLNHWMSNYYSFYAIREQSLGRWKDDNKHGKGTMDYASGDKYTGAWVNDNMTGQGVYTFASGNRYELKYSQITRLSLLNHWMSKNYSFYAIKEQLLGQWKDGNYHGQGKMTYENGTVREGMWSNDKFIGWLYDLFNLVHMFDIYLLHSIFLGDIISAFLFETIDAIVFIGSI
jgi:hypothetical protein